jgi:large subunit ribosomal protein L3
MLRLVVRDLTADSMTKNKKIVVPVTAIEVPPAKILSIRFYKKTSNGLLVHSEVLADNVEKELKKVIKVSKKQDKKIEDFENKLNEFDDIRAIIYSVVKKTGKKKTPDLAEIGLGGSIKEKFDFLKANLGKELAFNDFFEKGQLFDVRGITKGYGLQGPVKRMGIGFRAHKSEKGRRRPGSLGPWHPARVTLRAPMAGQTGFFTRVNYNQKLLDLGKAEDLHAKIGNFRDYGKMNTNYILIKGSVQGPIKRVLMLTPAFRETKGTKKENFEVVEVLK